MPTRSRHLPGWAYAGHRLFQLVPCELHLYRNRILDLFPNAARESLLEHDLDGRCYGLLYRSGNDRHGSRRSPYTGH
jgi:hypothetical protein